MLKWRILTAAVLVPLVIYSIFYTQARTFVFICFAIYIVAAWEWSQFIVVPRKVWRLVFFAFMLMVLTQFQNIPFQLWLLMNIFWWMAATYLVIWYPRFTIFWRYNMLKVLIAIFILVPFIVLLSKLRLEPDGSILILYVLLVVWSVDIGGYFCGRYWGKTQLIANVSPNKTWAGLMGSIALGLVVGVSLAFSFMPRVLELAHGWRLLVLTLLLTIFAAVLGDLTVSMFKREAEIKDTGKIFPGHGGLLDRIDSLLAALPVFIFALNYLGAKFTP